jgi:hypothetical protein
MIVRTTGRANGCRPISPKGRAGDRPSISTIRATSSSPRTSGHRPSRSGRFFLSYDLIATRRVADVVFGSRFYGRPHRSLYFHHYLGNRLISVLFNIMFDQTLTDIEACYKMMTSAVARSLRLTTNDFGIEVEVSARIARQRNLRIYEVGISYFGRTYAEGKKRCGIS